MHSTYLKDILRVSDLPDRRQQVNHIAYWNLSSYKRETVISSPSISERKGAYVQTWREGHMHW